MRTFPSPPSLVPADREATVCLVLDDFGSMGTAYRETDEARCDQQSVVDDLLTGQFNNPLRVVAFNTAEGWARDASADIAQLVIEAARVRNKDLSESARRFYERRTGLGSGLIKSAIQERQRDRQTPSTCVPACRSVLRSG